LFGQKNVTPNVVIDVSEFMMEEGVVGAKTNFVPKKDEVGVGCQFPDTFGSFRAEENGNRATTLNYGSQLQTSRKMSQQ